MEALSTAPVQADSCIDCQNVYGDPEDFEETGGKPKKFTKPTNPPQPPPAPNTLKPGETVRVMPGGQNTEYPDGYWRLYDKNLNPLDPSTGKQPGSVPKDESRSRTHTPLPPRK